VGERRKHAEKTPPSWFDGDYGLNNVDISDSFEQFLTEKDGFEDSGTGHNPH